MAKANLDGVPETGSKWELDGHPVWVDAVKKKGRGHYVVWEGQYHAGRTPLKEWERKAKAA